MHPVKCHEAWYIGWKMAQTFGGKMTQTFEDGLPEVLFIALGKQDHMVELSSRQKTS